MKIIFVNRYYRPDESATSQLLTDVAEYLALQGAEVHVVCSRQMYEDPAAALEPRATLRDVHVHRVWTLRFGRLRTLGRLLDYLTFHVTAALALLRLAERGDKLVLKTDPPLLGITGALVARLRGCTLFNWLQDLFPEVAARLAGRTRTPLLLRPLELARDAALRRAEQNVVLGLTMCDYVLGRGVPRERVRIIENWADGTAITPRRAEHSELKRRLNLAGSFVVMYSGNLGRAHDHATLLDAAELLRTETNVVFLMVGGGVRMAALRRAVAARHLPSFRFQGYQPRAELADSLAAGDVHLVSLLPQFEGLIVPSKLYSILAAGRPTLFIGDTGGEVARALRAGHCGVSVPCGRAVQLAAAILALRDDPDQLRQMAGAARQLFETRYDVAPALRKWALLLGVTPLADARPRAEPAEAVSTPLGRTGFT